MENVPAVLYVLYAGLPKEIQQVDFLYLDIAQAVILLRIPEYALAGCSLLELIPPLGRICLFVTVLLDDNWQDLRKLFCGGIVALLSRQHRCRGIVVHCVCVLICQGIEQPCRSGLGFFVRALRLFFPDCLPVPELPPLLIFDYPVLEICLAVFVFSQGFLCQGD